LTIRHIIRNVKITNKNRRRMTMPNRDGTGPAGKGAKTGGQRGGCEGAKPRNLPRNGKGEGKGNRNRGN